MKWRSLRGRVLANLTTGSPEQAREEAEWAGARGIGHLVGAVMPTPPGVGDSANMILYAGSPALLAEDRATLQALGDPVDLGPDAGLASLYDAGLLGLMWSVFGGRLHATALPGADATIDNRLPELHLELMRGAVAAGHGGDSYARIVEAFRK